MSNFRFILDSFTIKPFRSEYIETSLVRIPISNHKSLVQKGFFVYEGAVIAESLNPLLGDVHASLTGTVTAVTTKFICITSQEENIKVSAKTNDLKKDNKVIYPVEEIDFSKVPDSIILEEIRKMGVDLVPFLQDCHTLIINGLNPEPCIFWAPSILSTYEATLYEAVRLLQRLRPEVKLHLAATKIKGRKPQLKLGDLPVTFLKPFYPSSVNDLVIKAVCKKEKPEGVKVLSLHDLFSLAIVLEDGMPLTDIIMTIFDDNCFVRIGTPVGTIFEELKITNFFDGDTVFLGGPLTGKAIPTMLYGVGKHDFGLFGLKAKAFLAVADNPCVNCGSCVATCPSRLLPNFISRYAENFMFADCKKEHVDACIECGLCGYVCIVRRPMLQYMKMAKQIIVDRNI